MKRNRFSDQIETPITEFERPAAWLAAADFLDRYLPAREADTGKYQVVHARKRADPPSAYGCHRVREARGYPVQKPGHLAFFDGELQPPGLSQVQSLDFTYDR